jgi:hypothetical protein
VSVEVTAKVTAAAAPAVVVDAVAEQPPGPAPILGNGTKSPAGSKWLFLTGAVTADVQSGSGLRAELDLARWGGWLVGAGAFFFDEDVPGVDESLGYGDVNISELGATGYLAHVWRYGGWNARIAAALGLAYTSAHIYHSTFDGMQTTEGTTDGVYLTGELSARVGRELGARWAVHAGVLASAHADSYYVVLPQQSHRLVERGVEWSYLVGVGRRL